jgi:hypothetical protein
MTGSPLLESTETLIQESLPGEADLDTKVRQLLVAEYLRRIAGYRRADLALQRKYRMTFDQFVSSRTTQQLDYSWEVESDAMDWEAAIDSAESLERRLREIRADSDE